jgi:Putative adhesin
MNAVRKACRLASLLLPVAIGCGGGRAEGGTAPTPATAGTQAPGHPFHWSGHLSPGKSLDVRSVAGSIRAKASTGDNADVEATVSGLPAGETPPIRVVENERGVEVRVDWPHDGACGEHGERDSRLRVDFALQVPSGVHLVGRTVSGGITAESLNGPVDVHTVDGSIGLQRLSQAKARTVNGSITASFSGTDWSEDVDLSTVNGSIDVALPSSPNAELSANTLSGEVRVDFPIDGTISPHRAQGALGHGGRELRLRTLSGGIHVARM